MTPIENRNLKGRMAVAAGPIVLLGLLMTWAAGSVLADDDDNRFFVGVGEGGTYMGVHLEEETEYEEGGARVTAVVDDSPADKAGLQRGDIIVRFGDDVIRGPGALTKHIHEHEPGDTVHLTVRRDGGEVQIELELGNRSAISYVWPQGSFSVEVPEIDIEPLERLELQRLGDAERFLSWSFGWQGRGRLGVQLVEVTPELREHLGAAADQGVLVSKVIVGTPADKAGIRVGDLIVEVAGESIGDVSDLRAVLGEQVGETFDVQLVRDGRATNIEVSLPEPDGDRPSGPRAWVVPRADAVIVAPAPPVAPAAAPSPAVRAYVVAAPVVALAAPAASPLPAVPAPAPVVAVPPRPTAPMVAHPAPDAPRPVLVAPTRRHAIEL